MCLCLGAITIIGNSWRDMQKIVHTILDIITARFPTHRFVLDYAALNYHVGEQIQGYSMVHPDNIQPQVLVMNEVSNLHSLKSLV